jgi:SOS-response transcriptional repressor LexA
MKSGHISGIPRIESFAEFMRRSRGSRTKKEIANLLGVSYVYIAMFEKGDRYPPPDRLRQICALFEDSYEKWKRTIDWELEKEESVKQLKAYDILYNWYDVRDPLVFRNREGLEVTIQPKDNGGPRLEPIDPIRIGPDELHRIPVLSLARCGEWTQYTDGDYPVGVADEYVHGDTHDANAFYVRAEGQSMTRAGIDPGDLLLVEPSRSDRVRNGAIVLAITEQGQTVKRFYDTGELIVLQPDGLEGTPLTLAKEPKDPPDRIYPVTEIRKQL